MNIAILGSSGNVGQIISGNILLSHSTRIIPFSRYNTVNKYEDFLKGEYDVIVNCVGYGNPTDVEAAGYSLFTTSEKYDDMCIKYLQENPQTKYVFISSGAVHNTFYADFLNKSNFYQISKLNAEAKHRSLPELNIVDIRLYAFFNHFSRLTSSFFMSQLLKAIVDKSYFVTNHAEMVRDYINPKDLISLIEKCIDKPQLNEAFDTYSKATVAKSAILKYFVEHYKLKIQYNDRFKTFSSANVTNYFSSNRKAKDLGYKPEYTSMETIKEESERLLELCRKYPSFSKTNVS